MKKFILKYIPLMVLLVILTGCGKQENKMLNQENKTGKVGEQINGAGATFPFPIYSKWFSEYGKVNTDAKINYQSIGSGGGIKQLTEGTVDFGATDSPMKEDELKTAGEKNGSNVIHIPTVIGAVVLAYNIPGIDKNINLSSEAIAGIFLGKITKWNDPLIKADNPDVNLPDADIIVAHRTDGSGTTYVFTDYLSKVSEDWKNGPGTGKDVKFPVGQGGKGNEGVTGLIKQLDNSIGYVEYVYAIQNDLKFANVKNQNGDFVAPTLESTTKAADGAVTEMPDDMRQSITNPAGAGSYPIASYTYIILYQDQKNEFKGKTLKAFLEWALTDGTKFATELGYAPLPDAVKQKAMEKLAGLKYNGNPL